MTPEAALHIQIDRYRSMTPAQRIQIALELHEMACEMARVGIRFQNPNASDSEISELLRKRLELARSK
jgi:type II secretory pathway predicted ATPase ExeA